MPRAASNRQPALAGTQVCVVEGSLGEAWLDPVVDDAGLLVATPPPVVTIRRATDDDGCIAELDARSARAMVSDQLLSSDLATRRDIVMVGAGPVAVEPRGAIVPRDQPGADELVGTLDTVLQGLRDDGTLRSLALRWFGGEDLSAIGP